MLWQIRVLEAANGWSSIADRTLGNTGTDGSADGVLLLLGKGLDVEAVDCADRKELQQVTLKQTGWPEDGAVGLVGELQMPAREPELCCCPRWLPWSGSREWLSVVCSAVAVCRSSQL